MENKLFAADVKKYILLFNTGRLLILNINNYEKYDLVNDTINIAEEIGFEYIGFHTLKNIKRVYGVKGEKAHFNDNDEKMLVFIKNGYDGGMVYKDQLTIFDYLGE